MTSILVTGATGNVGVEILRGLVARGVPVRAALSPARFRQHPRQDGVEAVPFDFGDPGTYTAALHGVRRLFLMRPPAISDTDQLIRPVIRAAQAAGVEQIVFLSLLGAATNRLVPHYRIEQDVMTSGVPWTFLRPSFFMQNLSTTHRDDIRDLGEILVPAGAGLTSFIDVRDIASVAVRALTEAGHAGQAYPLTGSAALSYGEVAEMFSQELGRRIVYRRPSILRFVRQMRSRGLDWSYILVMVGIYTTARLGLAGLVTPHTEALLGRAPITMRQFVTDYRACWL